MTIGSIRIALWPMSDNELEQEIFSYTPKEQVCFKLPDYFEMFAHSDAITTLALNYDNSLLLSGSEDGTMFIFKAGI